MTYNVGGVLSLTQSINHKTISHRVRRECPMTQFPALPLLATNPGDATGIG